jgi:hypothetical protein
MWVRDGGHVLVGVMSLLRCSYLWTWFTFSGVSLFLPSLCGPCVWFAFRLACLPPPFFLLTHRYIPLPFWWRVRFGLAWRAGCFAVSLSVRLGLYPVYYSPDGGDINGMAGKHNSGIAFGARRCL